MTTLELERPVHNVSRNDGSRGRGGLVKRDGRLGLSPREAEVLGWIARGKTNKEIARVLLISPLTVRTHIENIFEKLDVHTRTAAVAALNGYP